MRKRRGPLRSGRAVLLALGLGLAAGWVEPAAGTEPGAEARYEIRYRAEFSPGDLTFGEVEGYDTIELGGCGHLSDVGRPMLPALIVRLALPPGMRAAGVRAVAGDVIELPGTYTVIPAQPPHALSSAAPPFTAPDPAVYTSSQLFPSAGAQLLYQTDLGGQGVAVARLHPVRYHPRRGSLTLATSLELTIEGVPGYVCGDYLPRELGARARERYQRLLTPSVVNAAALAFETASGIPTPSGGVGPGAYEYVIITQAAWAGAFQPLADWRTRLGIPTTIVTTEWIYQEGGYGGSEVDQLRSFVEDAHLNWGATCFLLGGDSNVVPYHVRTITIPGQDPADIPNDTYYADYDEDWICEVDVGRAPVRSLPAILTFIDKVFSYEKTPPLGGWATTAIFTSFDAMHCGDDRGEKFKDRVRDLHLPTEWTFHREYDSEPGSHRGDFLGYLDQGHHLFNHYAHACPSWLGAGWRCHQECLSVGDLEGLVNGERQSIAVSIGCLAAHFPTVTCPAEAFVRNVGGGGVAFLGNTHAGYVGWPTEERYTVLQDRYFYRALFDRGFSRVGECLSDLKNEAYGTGGVIACEKHCFTQFHLLGEPVLTIWTEEPQDLTVLHEATVYAGETTTFPVEVSRGGSPVEGTTVCLWKGGEVYEVAETDGLGIAVLEFTAATPGTLLVTASRQNCIPYEGTADVEDLPASVADGVTAIPARPAILSAKPNPFNLASEIQYVLPEDCTVSLEVFDVLGRRVATLVDGHEEAGRRKETWDPGSSPSGIYFYRLRAGGVVETKKMILAR